MGVHEIERSIAERKRFAIGDEQLGGQLLDGEILDGERDRRRCEVDACRPRAVPREANQIGSRPASDFEHAAASILLERHEAWQMMQLLEVILLEIGKEAGRARRVRGDLEIVNVSVPVRADSALGRRPIRTCGHGGLL